MWDIIDSSYDGFIDIEEYAEALTKFCWVVGYDMPSQDDQVSLFNYIAEDNYLITYTQALGAFRTVMQKGIQGLIADALASS